MKIVKHNIVAATVVGLLVGVAGAEPGDGIKIDNLTIKPFADLTAKYDSNVYQTDKDTKDDVIGEGDIGVAFVNETDQLSIGGRVWGQMRRYADHDDKDADDWGLSMGANFGSKEMIAIAVYGKYADLDDYDRTPGNVDSMDLDEVALQLTGDRSEKAKRKIADFDAGLGKKFSDKLEGDLVYKYFDVNYDDKGYYDWSEHRGKAMVEVGVTEKTAAVLTGIYGVQESDALEDNSTYGIGRVGFDHKLTAKTSLRAEGGFQHYESGAANASNKDIFNYLVRGTWKATDKITMKVSGKNGIYPASIYLENTKEVTGFSLGGYYALNQAIQLGLTGSYSEDDYENKVTVNNVAVKDTAKHYGGQFRVDYTPPVKFFNVYASVSYMDTDSTIEDYKQWKANLGLQMRY